VHQACAACPSVFRAGFRKHRVKLEVGMFALPLLGQFQQVEVPAIPDAPIEMNRPFEAAVEGILDHALHWRKSGGAGDEDDRAVRFAQHKVAERPLEADRVAHLHRLENMGGEAPARHQADLQLDIFGIVRRAGEGEGASLTVLEDDVDVLAGGKGDVLSCGQLDDHAHDVVGELLHLVDRADEFPHRGARQGELRLVFDFDVGQRRGAAHQHLAQSALGRAQGIRLIDAWVDLAVEHRALAQAAAAVAAFVGQVDLAAQAGIEDGLAEARFHGPVVGMHADVQFGLGAAAQLRRQPGHQVEQDRDANQQGPDLPQRPVVDERIDRQIEPVEFELDNFHREIGRRLAQHRLDQ